MLFEAQMCADDIRKTGFFTKAWCIPQSVYKENYGSYGIFVSGVRKQPNNQMIVHMYCQSAHRQGSEIISSSNWNYLQVSCRVREREPVSPGSWVTHAVMTLSATNHTIIMFITEERARKNSRVAGENLSADIRRAECAKTALIFLFHLYIYSYFFIYFYDSTSSSFWGSLLLSSHTHPSVAGTPRPQ